MLPTMVLPTVIRSLNFSEDRTDLLRGFSPAEWTRLLALTDEAHISLPMATRCRDVMPEPVRAQVDACIARNEIRHVRIAEDHARLAEAMRLHGAEFLVLKGLTHTGYWSTTSRDRPQYDIDLYCPPESMRAAAAAAKSLGYETVPTIGGSASDHLPIMIRRTGWRWRGDYYDPDQPLALELHHRFWNPSLGFNVHGADQFWSRKRTSVFAGVALPALHPADLSTYAAWHALRHMLGGSLKILHAYELAHFLHHSARDDEFWREWRGFGAPAGRRAESVAFRLAREWFGCAVNPVVEEYLAALPANVERWFRLFAFSYIGKFGQPGKDDLFLNLCLVENKKEVWRIAARRIVPLTVPPAALDAHIRPKTAGDRSKRRMYRVVFIVRRALFHLRTLAPVARSGIRWWFARPQ